MTTTGDLGIRGVDEVEPLDVEGSAVFRGRQRTHNRQVAIKILDPLKEPLVPRRFDIRRKALNRFAEMPGVVSIYEVGVAPDGNQYLMMPYFRIGSLADQMAHGPTPWHRAAELIKKTAEIVGRGHELGVVLGDLKPSSILLADASSPLVAVYGMATRRFDDGAPTYAAPETLRGATPTPAADVYSLALTLAALIAGRAPNRGWPSREFMAEVEALAPARIVEVIEHGLSENHANRFGSCVHLTTALSAALGGEPIVGVPEPGEADAGPLDWESLLASVAPAEVEGPALDEVLENPHWSKAQRPDTGATSQGRGRELTADAAFAARNGTGEPIIALDRRHDDGAGGPVADDLVIDLGSASSHHGRPDGARPAAGAIETDVDLRSDRPRWSAPDRPRPPLPPGQPSGALLDREASAPAPTAAEAIDARTSQPTMHQVVSATDHGVPRPPLLPAPPIEPVPAGGPDAHRASAGVILGDVEHPEHDPGNHQGTAGSLGDAPMPFRAFERQHLPALPSNPVLRFIETVQGAWFNRRRSYGGFLAVLSFALIAGLVSWLVVRDLQGPVAPSTSDSPFATFIDSSDAGGAEPTSQIPMLIEPPSTNSTTTIREAQRPRSTTTTAVSVPPPAGPAVSPSTAAPTTAPPATAAPTTAAPTTAAPTTAAPTTAAPTTAAPTTSRPRRTTTTEPPTTAPPADDDPEGLTMPLIERAEVTRVRATSARVGVTSPTCVTALFTYAPAGSGSDQVASTACSTAHTLLLGTVTPGLRAGTAYTVTVAVTDAEGRSATQTLAFTTLG